MKKLLLIICMMSMPVLADPVTWTIDATMNDHATITGSFVYDDDANLFSDLLLTYEGIGGTRTFIFPVHQIFSQVLGVEEELADYSHVPVLYLFTSNLLTNAGGTFNFEDESYLDMNLSLCDNSYCGTTSLLTGLTSGVLSSINTASVPEPGTMGLLAAGLAGLGAFRRRKRL